MSVAATSGEYIKEDLIAKRPGLTWRRWRNQVMAGNVAVDDSLLPFLPREERYV